MQGQYIRLWATITLRNSTAVALVDIDDEPLVRSYRWYLASTGIVMGYREYRKSQPVWVSLSRLLMGVTDRTVMVDHIDGCRMNNRRINLRLVTRQQNQYNSHVHKDNRSGYKGVALEKRTGRWRAVISQGGKMRTLGYTDDPEAAARLYDAAAREAHGEFARVNFPEPGEQPARR